MIDLQNRAQEYAEAEAKDLEIVFNEGVYNEEPCTLLEYIANQLELEYIVTSGDECTGVIVTLTFGGPSCYLIQHYGSARIECYWGAEQAIYHLSGDIARAIGELAAELYGVIQCA